MIVLGIDPGTARLGYGVLRKDGTKLTHLTHGCLETPKGMPQPERLSYLHDALNALISEHQPVHVGVEKLFFQKNVKTAMTVSEARGVVLLAMQGSGMAISEFTPMQIKVAVTGYGGADKRQVQEMVKRLLSLKEIPKPDDAADALAIAYCAAVSMVDAKRRV
ncbi:MAG: crossover junction endodeoxyribonuclease RuvC [Patescibacteria group bacterium]|nr:MAG: crossover junction endodeoxyribonuclease RuvC [Patescibacteria group bacterium]